MAMDMRAVGRMEQVLADANAWAFVREVAALTADGEEIDDGAGGVTEFILENDDAVSTLGELIDLARTLLRDRASAEAKQQ